MKVNLQLTPWLGFEKLATGKENKKGYHKYKYWNIDLLKFVDSDGHHKWSYLLLVLVRYSHAMDVIA